MSLKHVPGQKVQVRVGVRGPLPGDLDEREAGRLRQEAVLDAFRPRAGVARALLARKEASRGHKNERPPDAEGRIGKSTS